MNATLRSLWWLAPVLAALLHVSLLLILFGVHPLDALIAMTEGAFGTSDRVLSTLAFWVPLLLCATGLLLTFKAGLWNIGVEGQIVIGAVAASWVALSLEAPAAVLITVELLLAMAAGALWAALSAVLKTRGNVHEIFSGLALTNLAIILTNYLISSPWQPPEGGTFRGTAPFQDAALLPLFADSRFSPLSLLLAALAFAAVLVVLSNTTWGLKLKALGLNARSARVLGVSSEREAILAMMASGALAGLAGAIRTLSWFDSLRQSISGGIGYLALMVVMLAAFRALLVPLISFFFSIVLNGSIVLQLRTQLHSSLGGILTGVLVLLVLLFGDHTTLFGAPPAAPQEVDDE